MAMQYLDMTGKTEEEAISRALAQLGLDRDEVSVEILERAKSGFFGIGASPAKVRVTYGLEEPEPAPKAAPKPAEKKPEAPRPQAKPVEKPAEKPAEKKPRAVPAAAEEAPRPEKGERPERKKKKKPADKPQRRDQEAAGEEEIRRRSIFPCRSPRTWGSPAVRTTRRPPRSAPSWRASSSTWTPLPR